MNIKFNYLSNRVKAGIGAFLLVGSLSACNKVNVNNNVSISSASTSVSDDNSITSDIVFDDAYISLGVASKDLNFSTEEREFLDYVSTNQYVIFEIRDRNGNDYIKNLEVTIKDSNDKVVDKCITGSEECIIKNIDFNDGYRAEISNLSVEYEGRGNVSFNIKVDRDSFSSEFLSDDEYYKLPILSIFLEKERDRILNDNDKMLPGKIQVGAFDVDNGYIDGVKFAVYDEEGKEIDNWISTKTYHNVYNLADGNYDVKILDIPDDYEYSGVFGKTSDDFVNKNLDVDYNVVIKDGKYMDGKKPDKGYGGPTFYFNSSRNKVLDTNVKKLKK